MAASEAVSNLISRHGVEKLYFLPCGKISPLMARLPADTAVWNLTREAAGVALASGWALGGRRCGLLIQSTGLGNMVTELLTLPVLYELPLPVFVSWRGHYREQIEAQRILGERVVPMLKSLGVEVTTVDTVNDLAKVDGGLQRCFEESTVEVFLLSPQLWEGESVAEKKAATGTPRPKAVALKEPGFDEEPALSRYEAIETILHKEDPETIVLVQIGYPSREAYYAADRDRNFYLLGALGSATLVGLGLADARPDLEVLVLDGDGACLFNPNQLLELGQSFPDNLTVAVLDNGSWGSTGSQPTLSASGLNLPAMGRTAGTPRWFRAVTGDDWRRGRINQEQVIHFLIRPGNANVGTIPMSATDIRKRLQREIGLPEEFKGSS